MIWKKTQLEMLVTKTLSHPNVGLESQEFSSLQLKKCGFDSRIKESNSPLVL